MFDRLQKSFLTVETGEAYQPVRLTYSLANKNELISALTKLKCIQKNPVPNTWSWYWDNECADIHFESLDDFRKPERPLRIGVISLRDNKFYLNLPSFKRACLAIPFFHRLINKEIALVNSADFINKVFGLDEHLPHGFTELFKEEELEQILNQRVEDFQKVKEKCEQAPTANEAFNVLSEYTKAENRKTLPFAERYSFQVSDDADPEIIFLGFYIFLRSRELVAIKRWFGQSGYSLENAGDETFQQVFGEMNIE